MTFLLCGRIPEGGFCPGRTRLAISPLFYTWRTQFAIQAMTWDPEPALAGDLS